MVFRQYILHIRVENNAWMRKRWATKKKTSNLLRFPIPILNPIDAVNVVALSPERANMNFVQVPCPH